MLLSRSALRLHSFLPASTANGPGMRAVLWLQGCSLACPGCFNPATHSFEGGETVLVEDLVQRLAGLPDIEGVTISGGEPLQQRPALLALLRRLRQTTSLSVLVFTGFTWEEVQRFPEAAELLPCIDVLLAGRYEQGQHLALDLRGSSNKTVHFLSSRYGPEDLHTVPVAEVVIELDGDVIASGIDPLRF
jgi:anaerobic ribonucleoside-triphosphate reductase activating protein